MKRALREAWDEAYDEAIEGGLPEDEASAKADEHVADLEAREADDAYDRYRDDKYMQSLYGEDR